MAQPKIEVEPGADKRLAGILKKALNTPSSGHEEGTIQMIGRQQATVHSDVVPPPSECFLCEQHKQSGPHRYDGRTVAAWGIWICSQCRSGNWDGVLTASTQGQRLIKYLESRGIQVHLNELGHLAIPN